MIEEVEQPTGATWATGNLTDDTNCVAEELDFEWSQDNEALSGGASWATDPCRRQEL
jgi:hypothetical protein